MYKKILVPLDGSKLAECVLPHVEALARGCQVQNVLFVRVVEPFQQVIASEYVFKEEEVAQANAELKAESTKYLQQVVSQFKGGVPTSWEILMGRPAETLADYGTKSQADLIVIATHGRSGVSRWVWGSVADRILRSACIPVLMVRAPGCYPGI
jgi:nucleotide-binding universal stress UspA family protein